MNLDQLAGELDDVIPERGTGRWFRAVAEEAGEVVGAYNKMDYTGAKRRTREDVLEESGQLLGCMIVCLQRLGFSWDDLEASAGEFMINKAAQIRAEIRETCDSAI
jgi:phosphoribosyl-ATP pyrophosphohydrolase